ncbi:hypothetical protein FRC12_009564 [Ceratobasidium sp. 428]|nr:hypothetical protein FRC12_009564 [Ceratobasidium sp. 428]
MRDPGDAGRELITVLERLAEAWDLFGHAQLHPFATERLLVLMPRCRDQWRLGPTRPRAQTSTRHKLAELVMHLSARASSSISTPPAASARLRPATPLAVTSADPQGVLPNLTLAFTRLRELRSVNNISNAPI